MDAPTDGNQADPPDLLTVHGRVLLALAAEPALRVRDLAEQAGVTERTVSSALKDLERAGLLERRRVGRRNVYRTSVPAPLMAPKPASRS